jgi:hypothetical protein
MAIEFLRAGIGCPLSAKVGENAVLQGSWSVSILNDTDSSIDVYVTVTMVESSARLNYTDLRQERLNPGDRYKDTWEFPIAVRYDEPGQIDAQAFMFIRSSSLSDQFSDKAESSPCTFTVTANLEATEQYQVESEQYQTES